MRELWAALFLSIGGWWVIGGVRSFVLGLRSRSWPVASGPIRKAKLLTSRSSEGDDVSWQELEYTYSVNGHTYRNTRVRIGIPSRLASSARASELYRRGERVDVYYSKSHPRMSALRRGASPFVLVPLTAGAAAAWIGIQLLLH